MIILVASLCMAITFFVVRSLFGSAIDREKTVKTIEPINDGLVQPSKLIFNEKAINPTVEVYVEADIKSSDGSSSRSAQNPNQAQVEAN